MSHGRHRLFDAKRRTVPYLTMMDQHLVIILRSSTRAPTRFIRLPGSPRMKADRDWMINAACREHPPDDMFPSSRDKHGQQHALAICATCPVRAECARYAEQTGATHGIWAGQYRNNKHYTSHKPPTPHGTEAGAKAHWRRGEKPCDRCSIAAWEAKKRRLGAT